MNRLDRYDVDVVLVRAPQDAKQVLADVAVGRRRDLRYPTVSREPYRSHNAKNFFVASTEGSAQARPRVEFSTSAYASGSPSDACEAGHQPRLFRRPGEVLWLAVDPVGMKVSPRANPSIRPSVRGMIHLQDSHVKSVTAWARLPFLPLYWGVSFGQSARAVARQASNIGGPQGSQAWGGHRK